MPSRPFLFPAADIEPPPTPEMPPERKVGSLRLANFLNERILERGLNAAELSRLMNASEPGSYRLGSRKLERLLLGEGTVSLQHLHILGRHLGFDPRLALELLSLDEFDDLVPATRDPGELRAIGGDAYEMSNYGLAFVAWEKYSTLMPDPGTQFLARGNCARALQGLGMIDASIEMWTGLLTEQHLPEPQRIAVEMNLGAAYEGMGNLDAALTHNLTALKWAANEPPLTRARILLNRGNLLSNRFEQLESKDPAELSEAIQCYRDAAALASEAGDRPHQYWASGDAGRCMVLAGKVREGIEMLQEARDSFSQQGDALQVARFSCELGKALHRAGERERAAREMKYALTRARKAGLEDQMVYAALLLEKLAREEGTPSREFREIIEEYGWKVDRRIPELEAYWQLYPPPEPPLTEEERKADNALDAMEEAEEESDDEEDEVDETDGGLNADPVDPEKSGAERK